MLFSISELVRTIRSNPKKIATALLAFCIFVWDRFNDFQTGNGLMEDWLGPNWPTVVFRTVTGSFWFDVACLAVGFGCLIWIGVCARTGNNAGTQATREALRPITRLVRHSLEQQSLHQVESTLAGFFEITKGDLEGALAEFQTNGFHHHLRSGLDGFSRHFNGEFVASLFDRLGEPRPAIAFTALPSSESMPYVPDHLGSYRVEPAYFANYLALCRHNVAELNRLMSELSEVVRRKDEALQRDEEQILKDVGDTDR